MPAKRVRSVSRTSGTAAKRGRTNGQTRITDAFAVTRRRAAVAKVTEKTIVLAKPVLVAPAAAEPVPVNVAVAPESPTLRARGAKAGVAPLAIEADEGKAPQPEDIVPYTVPAYERFAALVAQSPADRTSLPLPPHFCVLQRVFGALDSICTVSAGRDMPAVFQRVVASVEAAVGRTVSSKHVDSLLAIMPGCYEREDITVVWGGKRVRSFVLRIPEGGDTAEALYTRRVELAKRMMERVCAAHAAFLERAGHVLPAGARLCTWHPDFDLSTVEPTVDDNLDSSALVVPATPRASETVAKAPEKDAKLSLLERIRLKEKASAIKAMTADPVRDAERALVKEMLSTASAVAMLFSQAAGRTALLVGDAVARITGARDCADLAPKTVIDRMVRLACAVPEWLTVSLDTDVQIVRLNRSVSYASVRTKLEARLSSLC